MDDDTTVNISEDFGQMYVEYKPIRDNEVKEVVFGPKASGMYLIQDMLIHHKVNIKCIKSKAPF